MKRISSPARAIFFACLFITLSSGECNESINVGYHYVPIPSYDIADYARMLRDPNPEIQYNAICALFDNVDQQYLDEDSLAQTPEHARDLAIYNDIFRLMDAENTWVSSAAIRYVGLYGYNHHKYLEHALSNNNPSVNVQLAIWNNFRYQATQQLADTGLLTRKIDFCYSHPSWLIRNSVYGYMTPLVAHRYEAKLWNEYRQAGNQHEKLLALGTLGNHMCDTTFTLITQEYERTQDTIARKVMVALLTGAPDKTRVLRWLRDRPAETFHALEMGSGSWNDTTGFYPKLLALALKQGMDPMTMKETRYFNDRTEEYPKLFDLLFKYKYETEELDETTPQQKEVLDLVEEKIAANPEAQQKWLAYASTHPRYPLPDALIREQLKITESYNRALTRLYDRYKVDSSMYKSYIENLPSLYLSLTRKRILKDIR